MSDGRANGSTGNGPQNFEQSYIGLRRDLLALVDRAPTSILEVGCATGTTGGHLKDRYGCRVTGIEIDPAMALVAEQRLDRVIVANLNRAFIDELVGAMRFDLILLGDVLEHLVDPWNAMVRARRLLAKDGRIITSVPNVIHLSTLASLVFLRRWPYRDRGIHDRTHLRFFTRKNLLELYALAGLSVERERRNLRFIDAPATLLNLPARLFDFPSFRSYLTYQYLDRLRPA